MITEEDTIEVNLYEPDNISVDSDTNFTTTIWGSIIGDISNQTDLNNQFANKQDTLISGTNIKTINNQSILGEGNLVIEGGGTGNYEDLSNLPQVNNVELKGNKSLSDLGLMSANDINTSLGQKADKSTTYTKTQVDSAIDASEAETDAKLLLKANTADVYGKSTVDTMVADKADNLSFSNNMLQLKSGNTLIGDAVEIEVATNDVVISQTQPQDDDWKIWIDSGQTENLGSEIAISSTTPTTNEPLWIKKGKNLINPSNINIVKSTNVNSVGSLSTGARVNLKTTNYGAYALFPIGKYKDFFGEKLTFSSIVKPNSTRNVGLMLWSSTTPDFASITNLKEKTGSASSSGTNIADTYEFNDDTLVDYYVGIGLYANYGNNPVTSTDYTDYTNLQVEANATQTSYEAYVDKGVYVKNNNNVYDKVYDENDVDKSNYTTVEQRIGTWINNKPLYRRIITGTTPSSTSDSVIGNIGTNKQVVRIDGYIDGGTTYQSLPVNFYFSDEYSIATYVTNDNGNVHMKLNSVNYQSKSITIVVEYIKTTD